MSTDKDKGAEASVGGKLPPLLSEPPTLEELRLPILGSPIPPRDGMAVTDVSQLREVTIIVPLYPLEADDYRVMERDEDGRAMRVEAVDSDDKAKSRGKSKGKDSLETEQATTMGTKTARPPPRDGKGGVLEVGFLPSPRPDRYSIVMLRRRPLTVEGRPGSRIPPSLVSSSGTSQPGSYLPGYLVNYATYDAPISWRGAFQRSLDGLRIVDEALHRSSRGSTHYIVPRCELVFRALEICPLETVQVCIIGQDPYADEKACGVAFSVIRRMGMSESVSNIYTEVRRDYPEWVMPRHADLTSWSTDKHILLLNSSLTTKWGTSGAHATGIWDSFVANVIVEIVKHRRNVVFLLWGANAKAFKEFIPPSKHHVLEASHPSPRSYAKGRTPFRGCGHFKAVNAYRAKHKLPPVDWTLPM